MAKLGYRACLDWLLLNDDTEFIDDETPICSVTLCLVADMFGKDQEDVFRDLVRRRAKLSVEQ